VCSSDPALLAGMWAGILVCIGALAAPAAFALLARPDAGRFVGRLFEQEAYLSLALAVVLLIVERGRRSGQPGEPGQPSLFSANLMLLLGTLFCTVAGHFALLPMMGVFAVVSFIAKQNVRYYLMAGVAPLPSSPSNSGRHTPNSRRRRVWTRGSTRTTA